jgi:hypothetical protein
MAGCGPNRGRSANRFRRRASRLTTMCSITALALNTGKARLYIGESRSAVHPTTRGLSVHTLDASGHPDGAVRTYPNGNVPGNGVISCLLLHPALPLLSSA